MHLKIFDRMKSRLSVLFIILFVIGDLLLLNASIFLSYQLLAIKLVGEELGNGIYLFIFTNLVWFYVILLTNPYVVRRSAPLRILFRSQLSFLFVHLLVLLSLVLFFDKTYQFKQILLAYCIFIPILLFWRLLFFYMIGVVGRGSPANTNYVIVGMGDLAYDLRRNFRFHPEYGYKFLGFFSDSIAAADIRPYADIRDFCIRMGVKEIYCCWPHIKNEALKDLINFGLDNFIKVKLVTDTSKLSQKGLQLERIDQIPVVNVAAIPLDESVNQIIKRLFDLFFTLFTFVTVLIWLIPLVAILIKIDSRGPVLFRQQRAGKGNRPFMCFKFRTMILEDGAAFVQATVNDPRITRLGKILRKTSLDEFPQFFNVLAGDMSVVGPRPHPIKLNDDFADRIRKLMSRHYVKPGITGLAQCMGYRGETRNLMEMKNRITLDRFYVERWSLGLDLMIILKTVKSLLVGSKKAY
jgi:putative colanic acid biosynthesis UDP-glucose lipid carrier transferase